MRFTQVKRTRVYEDIVTQLTDMIAKGELKRGDRLPPERELADLFGVGRTTVRQALTVLAEAGVVDVVAGSGVYLRNQENEKLGASGSAMAMVLMTERQNLFDILELRIGIEGEAAYLAAERRLPEHVERLTAAYHALETAFVKSGSAMHEDYQFHYQVAEATRNPVFLKVMSSLADLFMQGFRQTTQFLYDEPDRVQSNLAEHRAILDAIVAQNADAARLAMTKHLRRVSARLAHATHT